MRCKLGVLVFFIVPSAVFADQIGEVSATFDGSERQWYTLERTVGEQTAASASFRNTKRLSSLNIQAHPEPRFSNVGVLSISASWFGTFELGKAPVSVEVLYLPEGMSNPFYTSDQVTDGATLAIESINLDEGSGHITGRFTAKLCHVTELYEAPDMGDCKDIDGAFDTKLQVR